MSSRRPLEVLVIALAGALLVEIGFVLGRHESDAAPEPPLVAVFAPPESPSPRLVAELVARPIAPAAEPTAVDVAVPAPRPPRTRTLRPADRKPTSDRLSSELTACARSGDPLCQLPK